MRGAAVGGALCSGLAVLLFAMLANGGLSLNVFRPAVSGFIRAETGVDRVEVGDIRFVRDAGGEAPFRLSVADIRLIAQDGNQLSIPGLSLRLDSESLFRGQPMPRFVEITGAEIAVERGGTGVSLGGRDDAGAPLDVGSLVAQARRAGFEGAVLRDLTLRYRNRLTGASFDVANGVASIESEGATYVFRLDVPYEEQGGHLSLDLRSDVGRGAVEATLTVDNAPATAILPLFMATGQGVALDAPISGTITASGRFTDGFDEMGIALFIGEGELSLGDHATPVTHVILDGQYRPQSGALDLRRLDVDVSGNRGIASGTVSVTVTDGQVEAIPFDIVARDILLDPDDLFEAPLPLSEVAVAGEFNPLTRIFDLKRFEADYFGAKVLASGSYAVPEAEGQSPGLSGTVTIDGPLSPADVLRGWPVALGDGARSWVATSLPKGKLSNVQYRMALPRGALAEGALLTPEQIDLSFDARDATVIYVPGMRPITGLSATGRLSGNSFSVTATGGRIGTVRVAKGSVEMPQLAPKGAPGYFRATAIGAVSDLLAILDEKPLGYVTAAGFAPDQFSGDGTFDIEIARPLLSYVPIEDYGISGNGTFSVVEIRDLLPGLRLEDGNGTVKLSKNDLTISGDAVTAGVPASFRLVRQFGGMMPMSLSATTRLDGRTADALGLPFRRFVQGAINLAISAQGHSGTFQHATVRGDLSDATLLGDRRDVLKPAGEPGEFFAELDLSAPDGGISIDTMRLTSAGLNIEGNARLDNSLSLVDLDLPRLFIDDFANLSVRVRRELSGLIVKVEGDYAYLGSIVSDLASGGSTGRLPGSIEFDAQVQLVELKGAIGVSDVRLSGRHDGVEIARLMARGSFDDGGEVTIDLMPSAMGLGRDVTLRTAHLGKTLQGIFTIDSVLGGAAVLTATALPDGPVAGTFTATDFVVQDAPTVARLLSVGSLSGLANVLNGDGIEFDSLKGDIQITDGRLRFVDTRLTGSALGLSANGDVNLRSGVISLHGAIAPAYQVNSLLGIVPGLGELLVSREGEGIFALAYRLEGPLTETTVSVNTLAALTPGIFRRVFEPITGDRPTTDELLSAAQEAAGMSEARDYLSTPELLRDHESLPNRTSDVPQTPR